MGGKAQGAPKEFAAQLIAALEDAQAAAAVKKPASQLAQAAFNQLQFDFPVVAPEGLAALVEEYASGDRRGVSSRFLGVLRDSADSAATGSDASGPAAASMKGGGSSSAASDLVPLYQQLYAVAVVQSLCTCLEAPEAAAAAQLASLHPGGSVLSAEGYSQLEQVLAGAAEGAAGSEIELEHRLSQQEDDDSTAYEPIEQLQRPLRLPACAAPLQSGASGGGSQASVEGLPDQLAELAGHLSYHSMADAGAWRELRLMQRLAACLAAARRHPRFLELEGVAQPLLRLATDRLVAAPVELEAGLPAIMDALGVPGSSSSTTTPTGSSSGRGGAKEDAAAAELALAAAVALAAQVTAPAARRQLWQEVHQRLLPLAAQQLEQQQIALARQARAGGSGGAGQVQPGPQQLYRIALPCQLVYFYVLQAPPAALMPTPGSGSGGASRVHEALLRGGLLRSLVLLFVQLGGQPGVEPLRCTLLLACTAGQPLVDWAAAVPGFATAVAAPPLQPGGDAQLHGALWQVLLGHGGAQLAALLADARPADKVPGVYQALQVMADMQAVSRRPAPLWDAAVDAALRDLAATLRQHYSKPRKEEQAAAAAAAAAGVGGEEGGQPESAGGDSCGDDSGGEADGDDERDARKLAVGAEEQAELLAERRAQQLQPACLKLIKDLLQRHGGGGSGGKHD